MSKLSSLNFTVTVRRGQAISLKSTNSHGARLDERSYAEQSPEYSTPFPKRCNCKYLRQLLARIGTDI